MKNVLFLSALILFVCSCNTQSGHTNKFNQAWLDSIVKKSDSTYTTSFYRTDFVTASFYINKKDSTVCQVMKDSAGTIRQIIITKKEKRIFFGSYYKNGQLQADLPLDEFGQYHGTGKFYYEDGSLQSTGNYTYGFKIGQWKVYDKKGEVTNTDTYDESGI